MHLLDVTMLYAPTSGGVVRYLRAKRAWLRRRTSIRHSLLVPGDADGDGPASGLMCVRSRFAPWPPLADCRIAGYGNSRGPS
jgi:alpha-1,6-mannosyltransferase